MLACREGSRPLIGAVSAEILYVVYFPVDVDLQRTVAGARAEDNILRKKFGS